MNYSRIIHQAQGVVTAVHRDAKYCAPKHVKKHLLERTEELKSWACQECPEKNLSPVLAVIEHIHGRNNEELERTADHAERELLTMYHHIEE